VCAHLHAFYYSNVILRCREYELPKQGVALLGTRRPLKTHAGGVDAPTVEVETEVPSRLQHWHSHVYQAVHPKLSLETSSGLLVGEDTVMLPFSVQNVLNLDKKPVLAPTLNHRPSQSSIKASRSPWISESQQMIAPQALMTFQ
jgi:hypothetical protein